MAELLDLPEPDRIEGAPHPRETTTLFGHAAAEAAFLEAFASGRLHHAWLISGPRGVGKATLAWRIARFLRANPASIEAGLFGAPPVPASLDIAPDHPVTAQARALSEPGIFLLRRGPNDKGDRLSDMIRVDEVRKMRAFFGLSVIDGGRRVVIVDSADEMNPQAANALLKSLEEPPAGTVFLLISHAPSRLLPTIRSRTRALRVGPLGPDDLARALAAAGAPAGADAAALAALAALAGGSVGEALRLGQMGGLEAYGQIVALLSPAPRYDRPAAIRLAESCAGAANAPRLDLVLALFDLFLARLAQTGAGRAPKVEAAPGEAALFARLAPGPHAARAWAARSQELSSRARHGVAVNLDPAALILDMVIKINETAGSLAR